MTQKEKDRMLAYSKMSKEELKSKISEMASLCNDDIAKRLMLHMPNLPINLGDGLKYELSPEGELIVLGFRSSRNNPEEIFTPAEVVGRLAFTGKSITKIEMPLCRVVKEFAFCGCLRMKELRLPNSLEKIEKMAFGDLFNLNKIKFGKNLKVINEYAFENDKMLERVSLPNSIEVIEGSVFFGCEQLNYLKFPKGLTSVPESTCFECSRLKTIVFPENVKIIETCAFYNCGLEHITLPDTLRLIGAQAFARCTALQKVNINKSLEIIEANAFAKCYSLKTVNLSRTTFLDGQVFDLNTTIMLC